MSPSVSIVICCYNSATRLPETLAHLARQEFDNEIEWEILVVDNASTDGTAEVAMRTCPIGIRDRLRIVSEAQVGRYYALTTGFKNAHYDIVSFVDDDNWVNPRFIDSVSKIFSKEPLIGIAGGPSKPVFESSPPEWFEEICEFYALGDQQPKEGDITDNSGHLLWGAGSSVRRSALHELFDKGFIFNLTTTTRLETKRLGGEDTELCFAIRALGWRLWYDSRLGIKHFIPKSRLTWSYAHGLFSGSGSSAAYLEMYLIAFSRWPFDSKNRIKNSWVYQFAKSAKNLFVSFITSPLQSLSCREGSIPALHFKRHLEKTRTLLSLLGQYKKKIQHIRNARWNKVG
ncbi:MAG: glycosyltransferase [bacterium]